MANPYCQTSVVSGLVLDVTTQQPLAGAKVDLKIKNAADDSYKIIATQTTDSAGSFIFKNIQPQHYALACFYKMSTTSTDVPKEIADVLGRSKVDSNLHVLAGSTYTHTFYLMVACPYDTTKNQGYCPVCKKQDMVKPILWGLVAYDIYGKAILRGKDIDDYYLGGCSPDFFCNPTRHCRRCNVDF